MSRGFVHPLRGYPGSFPWKIRSSHQLDNEEACEYSPEFIQAQ